MTHESKVPTQVERRNQLDPTQFVTEYLAPNRPVIVTDALNNWPGMSKWNLEYFRSHLGHEEVQVQGETFTDIGTMSFAQFLDSLEGCAGAGTDSLEPIDQAPYVRRRSWTDAQQDVVHQLVADDWHRPDFLPESHYLVPLNMYSSHPNIDRHPYFSLYFSPRGGVTGLHVDPLRSSSVLCHVSGRKYGCLFPPSSSGQWKKNMEQLQAERSVRKLAVLAGERPQYGDLEALEVDLMPGETLYIPMGWLHEVFTIENSISLTYNFIHPRGLSLGWCVNPDTWRSFLRAWRKRTRRERKSGNSAT